MAQIFAQVLGQDLVILAVGLDIGQASVEHIQQFLAVCAEDCKTIGGGVTGGIVQDLQGQAAVLDGSLHDGGILEAGNALAAQDSLVHRGGILKVGDVEAVLVLQAFGISSALGAGLDSNGLAVQVSKTGNVGVLRHGHGLGGIIVAVRESPARSLAFVGDGSAGDHTIGLASLAGSDGGIPAQALHLVVKALVLGDGRDNININADKVAGSIGVLKGLKDGVGSDDPGFACGIGGLCSGFAGSRLRGSFGSGFRRCSAGSSTAAGSQREGHGSSHAESK